MQVGLPLILWELFKSPFFFGVKFIMTKFRLMLTMVISSFIFNSVTVRAEDYVTPYASLTLWTAWSHRTAVLGEGLILIDEVEGLLEDRIDYQSDVTSTASSFIGIEGEKDNVYMKAEFGVYPYSSHGKSTLLGIRYFYGAYNLGPLELRGGYDMSPYQAIDRNDVTDGEIFADAAMFESFQPQLRVSAYGAYFQIMRSVIHNEELHLDSNLSGGVSTNISNTESFLPKMALGYIYSAENFTLGAHGIFQSYNIDEDRSKFDGKAITAAVGSIAMKGNFGSLSLNISGFIGQNPGELGIFTNNNKNGSYIPFHGAANNFAKTDTSTEVQNTLGYGFSASGGYDLGFLLINAGFAYDRDENEVFKSPLCPDGKDDSFAYFASLMFALKPNLKLVPTIKVIDYLKTAGNVFTAYDEDGNPLPQNTEEGVLTRFGFAFQASI